MCSSFGGGGDSFVDPPPNIKKRCLIPLKVAVRYAEALLILCFSDILLGFKDYCTNFYFRLSTCLFIKLLLNELEAVFLIELNLSWLSLMN